MSKQPMHLEQQATLTCKSRPLSALVLLGLILIAPFEARARANFVEPGSFRVLKPCQAYTSFRKKTGAVDLEVDKTYVAHGENKATSASHVHIDVGGIRKWVSLECGDYEGQKPSFIDQSGSGGEIACLAFFDDLNNLVKVKVGGEVDITPLAPPIEPFGTAVNAVCGSPGKVTSETEFKHLLKDHPQVLTDTMAYTGGKVFTDRPIHQDTDTFLDDLAEAWYANHAFDHIFCGEPTGVNKIGGLHYHGRYQQLQESGEGCRLPNFDKNEVVTGSIYTIGVRMKRADGGWAQFPTKGYGLTFSAADILKLVTRAFAENPTPSTSSTGCTLEVDDGGVGYSAVFVRRATGIRTFFPDATPDPVRNPSCANPLALKAAGGSSFIDERPNSGGSEAQALFKDSP